MWRRFQADGLVVAQSDEPEQNCLFNQNVIITFNQNVMVMEHSYEGLMGQEEVELKTSLD